VSEAATDLISRLRPVWPEPTELQVTRAPRSARRDQHELLVLPALSRPILLVPAGRRGAAGAIVRFDDGQRARLSLRLLAWAQARGVLRLAPVARVRVGTAGISGVVEVVREAVPEADSIVVRLGRRRHGRAVILHALDADGRSLAFAKCAWGPRVADLRLEHDSIVDVTTDPVAGVRAPKALAFVELDDAAVLVLEALTPSTPLTPAAGAGVPVAAMRALAGRRGWRRTTVAGSEVVQRLREGISALPDEAPRSWLEHELARLVDELGDVDTRTGSWHGDWVAWNMARDGAEILLWDWEHHEHGVFPGFDHLHFLAQDLRLRIGTTPDVEDTWLTRARQELADAWDVRGAAAEAAIRSYLLVVNLRYVSDREGDPQGSSHRAGWSRALVERLGTPAAPGVPS